MLTRRECLRTVLAAGAATGLSTGWAGRLAAAMREGGKQRHLVVLWMPVAHRRWTHLI